MKENWSSNDFDYIKCDISAKQTYPFDSIITGMTIKGVFYDKFTSGSYKYVYIDDPEIKINGVDQTGTSLETSYSSLFGKMGVFQPLDIRTRCPNLETFTIGRSGNQVLYATSDTKRPDNFNPFTQLNNAGEQLSLIHI